MSVFDTDKHSSNGGGPPGFRASHAELLGFLRSYHRTHFKINHVRQDYDIGQKEWENAMKSLSHRGLIEKWNRGSQARTVWFVTEKGEAVDLEALTP